MRNRWHAICPYFAMFPESFPEKWVKRLTVPGDLVFDPFSGRGTTAFQALLLGREAVACDINPVAYCVTRAKLRAPEFGRVGRRLHELESQFRSLSAAGELEEAAAQLPSFFRHCYSRTTLLQVLFLRQALNWRTVDTDSVIAAVTLAALHGESHRSPSYLSNRMPRTISTKPAYSIRFWRDRGLKPPRVDTFAVLSEQIAFRYASPRPPAKGEVVLGDMRRVMPRLARRGHLVDCVVTSPPYLDVTSYEEDQWLRHWFLGGPPRPTYGKLSPDDRLLNMEEYWSMIHDMWIGLASLVKPKGHVVVRLGSRRESPAQIVAQLKTAATGAGRSLQLVGRPQLSDIRDSQTRSFRPGARGCVVEVDCHFQFVE